MRTTPWRAAATAVLLLLLGLAPSIALAQSPDPAASPDATASSTPEASATPDPATPTPAAPTPAPVRTLPGSGGGAGTSNVGPAAAGISVDLNIVPAATKNLTFSIKLPTTDSTGSGVKAWFVSENGTTPSAGASGWRSIKPTTFTLTPGEGVRTVHAWAKAKNGAISARSSDTVKIDQTAPTVELTAPEDSASRTIAVSLVADDPLSAGTEPAAGVNRWAVVSGTTAPGKDSTAWKTALPTTFKLPAGNGTKTVSAFVRDAAGNVSAASTVQVELLIAGPVVTLTMPAIVKGLTPPITISATDPGGTGLAGFYVSTNGTLPSGTISWLTKPTKVTIPAGDGPKTVYAWAKDNNGTVSARVQAATVLDTAAPVVSMTAAATTTTIALPVTISATDGGAGVVAYAVVNGTSLPADATNAWKPEPPTSLTLSYGNGTKTFTAFAKDAAGNVSAPVTLTVAMTVPAPSISSFTMPTWSKARATAVTIAVSDTGGTGIAGYFLSESGTTPALNAAGWVIAASTVTLTDVQGAHTVYAWVKDKNGSISARAQASTNLDTIKPVVVLTAPAATKPNAISVSLATTETGSGAVQWAVVNGTNPPATGFPEWKNTAPTSFTLPGADGSKTISAFVRDLAGNVSVASTKVVIVDNVAPAATLSAPAATSTRPISVTVGGTDNASGVAAYAVVDGTVAPDAASPLWSASPQTGWTLPVNDSTKTISAFVRDLAGNVSPAASAQVILDTTAPGVWLDAPDHYNSTTPWVSVWDDDWGGSGVTHWAIVQGTSQPAPGSATWVTSRPSGVTVTAGDGAKTVSIWARDALGHVSAIDSEVITIDTVAPTVSLGALPARTNNRTINVSMSGSDNASGIAKWAINESGSAPSWGSNLWKNNALTSYTISGSEGTRTLRAWTRDNAGNVSLASVQTIVLDTVAPVITFTTPAVTTVRDITLTVSGNDGSGTGITGWAVVEGTSQPALGDGIWTGSPATSFQLPAGEGSTQVTVFAKDLAGNVGSVTRTVVLDTVAPSATLSATSPSASRTVAVTVGGSDGAQGSGITAWAVVEGTTAPAAGNAAWVASAPTTFQVSAGDGTKTISAFTRDAAGLVSVAATTTVLLDTTVPTVTFSAPTTTTTATIAVTVGGADGGSGLAGYVVVEGVTAPAVGSPSWSVSAPTTFTLSGGLGTKTISAFTKDQAGNISLASTRTVTVSAP
jgi:hypothetical protein